MPSTDKFALEVEIAGAPAPKPPREREPLAASHAFAAALVSWFEAEGRDYPWRRTRDPYAVLVSEVMLQQTQIATVLSKRYYERWLETFPDVETLAAADPAAVLKAWEGLGYYRRARNLQAAARRVLDDFGGNFPRTAEQIQKLPGVGRYTAGAVASFACGEAAAIVDGNIARVLARIFDYHEQVDGGPGQRQLWQWAEALLPDANTARAYNSALMELGQRHCRKTAPACHRCPVAGFCATTDPSCLPRKKAAAKIEKMVELTGLIIDADRGVLLEQIPAGERREGLWRLPVLQVPPPPATPVLWRSSYGITRYRVELVVYQLSVSQLESTRIVQSAAASAAPSASSAEPRPQGPEIPNRAWFSGEQLKEVAMPAPYRKAVDALAGRSKG